MHMTRTTTWHAAALGDDVTAQRKGSTGQDSTRFRFRGAADGPGSWLVGDVVSLALCWRTQPEAEEGGLALDLCGERTGVARRSILGCAAPTCLLAIPWHSGVAFL